MNDDMKKVGMISAGNKTQPDPNYKNFTDALGRYFDNHENVDSHLRRGAKQTSKSGHENTVKWLDHGFNAHAKVLDKDTVFHRVMPSDFIAMQGNIAGKHLHDRAYLAVNRSAADATKPTNGEWAMFHIKVPKGTSVVDPSDHMPNTTINGVLLNRGARLNVTRHDKDGMTQRHHIYAELIGHE